MDGVVDINPIANIYGGDFTVLVNKEEWDRGIEDSLYLSLLNLG